MRESSRIVVGIDETWTVVDQALSGDLELKYTVDSAGTELLLYRDSVAPAILTRDRIRVAISRVLALLPDGARLSLATLVSRLVRFRSATRDRIHRWRAKRLAGTNIVPVGGALRPHYAAQVTEYDWATEEAAQRRKVLAVLQAAGIAAAVVPPAYGRRAVIVIREEDRGRACDELARGLGRTWHVVPLDTPAARPHGLTARRLQRMCARSDGFRIFRYVAAAPGRVLAGAATGCDVEVWRSPRPPLLSRASNVTQHADTLVAPRRNAWVTRLAPDAWAQAHDSPENFIDVGSYPHAFDVRGDIDVVYTWVDGEDPAWQAEKAATMAKLDPDREVEAPVSLDAARFRSRDELRYSLRSLEMYAPWVRTIHIVTAGQVPPWLDVNHPKVRLVHHRDIFADPSVLPVFNSHAIESQLHRVPGLAQRYIYLNDDVFFGRPVAKELFFHANGLAKFFLSTAVVGLGPRTAADSPVASAAKNNRLLIETEFGRTVTHQFQHAPHPQLRSVLEEMNERYPDVFRRVAASAFRSPDDFSIASALHHFYAYQRGKAVPGRLEYLYLDMVHPGAPRRLEKLLAHRSFDVFCINDTVTSPRLAQRQAQVLQSFLSRYFPLPSSFEIGSSEAGPAPGAG